MKKCFILYYIIYFKETLLHQYECIWTFKRVITVYICHSSPALYVMIHTSGDNTLYCSVMATMLL